MLRLRTKRSARTKPDVATSDEAEREDEVSVTVIVDIPEDGLVPEGATISFVAMIQGAEPADLMFQWQFSRDGESWEDIDGAKRAEL